MFPTFEAGHNPETVGQRREKTREKRAGSRASNYTTSSDGSSNPIRDSLPTSSSSTSSSRRGASTKSKTSKKSSGGFFFKRRSRDVIEIIESPKEAPAELDVELPIQQHSLPEVQYEESRSSAAVSHQHTLSPITSPVSPLTPVTPMSPMFKMHCSEPLPPPTPPPVQAPPPLPKDARNSRFPKPPRNTSVPRRPVNPVQDDRPAPLFSPATMRPSELEIPGETMHTTLTLEKDLLVGMTDLGIHQDRAAQRSRSRNRLEDFSDSPTRPYIEAIPERREKPAVVKPVQERATNRVARDRENHTQPPVPKTPFGRLMTKIKKAGPSIVATRLDEEWEDDSDEETKQEMAFEKRLWALTVYEWLTQGKQMQSPTHDLLSGSMVHQGLRVLHIHGSIADGWVLAARYPAVTVFTVSSQSASSPMASPAPTNHHSLYLPSLAGTMPFPDCYFDAVISRTLPSALRSNEWDQTFHECMRVLKPGAHVEMHTLDPYMTAQGPMLRRWVSEEVTSELEAHDKSKTPSSAVIDAMGGAGLQDIKQARIALPVIASESSKLLTHLGRYLYRELYGSLVGLQGEEWFWDSAQLEDECRALRTHMVLTIACSQKPEQF